METQETIKKPPVRIVIHPVKLVAMKNDVEVELTLRELQVLAFFIANRGRLIPRKELYANLWTNRGDGYSNIADVYVNYLRQKLGKDTIETVRGEGYLMAA